MTVLAGGVAYSLLAGAQQKAMPVVGYLHFASPDSKSQFLDALRQGLTETG